ncbi:MAG: hypothetical protein IKG88_04660 [Bacteroidales bacterium]|nr:hypothetical protein [Bacteroidales bacterium]
MPHLENIKTSTTFAQSSILLIGLLPHPTLQQMSPLALASQAAATRLPSSTTQQNRYAALSPLPPRSQPHTDTFQCLPPIPPNRFQVNRRFANGSLFLRYFNGISTLLKCRNSVN